MAVFHSGGSRGESVALSFSVHGGHLYSLALGPLSLSSKSAATGVVLLTFQLSDISSTVPSLFLSYHSWKIFSTFKDLWLDQGKWLTYGNLPILRSVELITSEKSLLPCKFPRIRRWTSSGFQFLRMTSKYAISFILPRKPPGKCICYLTNYPKIKWFKRLS